MDGAAQHGVAEVAGRHRHQVSIVFLAYRGRGFLEDEELVLDPGLALKTHGAGLVDDAA